MAVRFDNSGETLSRTTNLPSITSFSFMAWCRRRVTRNAFAGVLTFGAAASSRYYGVYLERTSNPILVVWDGGALTNGSALTDDVWYHVAMTVAGTGAGQFLVYLNGTLAITASGNALNSAATLQVGASLDNEWLNGTVAAIKIYDAVLTAAEIQAEMWSIRPRRTANLYGVWPCWNGSGERTRDYSGNERNWTEGGTLTDEDGANALWYVSRPYVLPQTATSGNVYVDTGTAVSIAKANGLDTSIVTDTGKSVSIAQSTGLDVYRQFDIGNAVSIAKANGIDVAIAIELGKSVSALFGSGNTIATMFETGKAVSGLVASGSGVIPSSLPILTMPTIVNLASDGQNIVSINAI